MALVESAAPAGIDAPKEGVRAVSDRSSEFTTEATQNFANTCEFISLGCYCVVAEAFKHLGVRKRSYPFDWIRSPMQGVIQCFENDFEDFLTYVEKKEIGKHTVFVNTRWGGSFWHHDIDQDIIQQDFNRRIDRLLAPVEITECTPRFCVRILNSSNEIGLALQLLRILRQTFPMAPVYLLLIVEMQDKSWLARLNVAECEGLLFYFVNFDELYPSSLQEENESFQFRSHMISKIVSSAIGIWAGIQEGLEAVYVFDSLQQLTASCEQYSGGNCGSELFHAQYFKGRSVRPRKPAMMPKLFHGQNAEFLLPENIIPGGPLEIACFDMRITLVLPANAVAGYLMKLHLFEGVVTSTMVITSMAIASSTCSSAAIDPK